MIKLETFLYLMEVIAVGIILSIDSFSAAVALGSRPFKRSDAIKFAFSSGFAEAMVALFGALAGNHIIAKFSAIDHWIAFILLALISLHMAYEGICELKGKVEVDAPKEFHSFTKILVVSFATSMDAFGVGIGLGIKGQPLPLYIISIGVFAFLSTIAGLYLSKKLSKHFGPIMNLVGAVILMGMAFLMLKI